MATNFLKDCLHVIDDMGNLKLVRVDEKCPHKVANGNMFLANAYRCKDCKAYEKNKTAEETPQTAKNAEEKTGEYLPTPKAKRSKKGARTAPVSDKE